MKVGDKEGGGPAFPQPMLYREDHGTVTPGTYGLPEGMNLRQYYAGQVLAGLTSGTDSFEIREPQATFIAESCRAVADAMIKAMGS